MTIDTIYQGQGNGLVANALMQHNFQVGALRPFEAANGRTYITINGADGQAKAVPVVNNTATLRRYDWIQFDTAVLRAAKARLRAVADVRGAGLVYTIPNGLGRTVLEYEAQSDITDAEISMDGLKRGEGDRPVWDLRSLPLPIIHKDFQISARQLAASRNGGSPLDTTSAELAGRRVAEEAEKLLLGVYGTYAFGGGTVYGFTNFPFRATKSLADPAGGGGYTPASTLADVLDMKAKLQAMFHYGPYMLYASPGWDKYLDNDYSTNTGTTPLTLRNRLRMIDGITDVRTLDYLPAMTMVLVEMSPEVIREVVGMDVTTVQWESQGGMMMNFKVMAIMVPQLRQDINNNTGICHGSV